MALTKITSKVLSSTALTAPIGIANSSANVIAMSADGRVGIGAESADLSSFARKFLVNGTGGFNNNTGTVGVGFARGSSNTYGYIGTGDWAVNGLANADFGISSGSTGALVFGTGAGTERARITSAGILSTPYKPFVNGYPNGAAITTATKTSLTSSTVQNATFSNSRFTCPVTGLYECVLNTTVQTGYNENDVWVYKNGSPLTPNMGSWAAINSDWISVHLQVVIPCAANDYLEFYWRGNMYGNVNWNYFHFMHVG